MKTILVNKIVRIIKNHKRLMEELDVKITNRGKEVTIDGTPENELIAEQAIEALNFGFPYTEAINMKKEGKVLETVNIKEHTNQKNLERVRGRVIGQGGRTLSTLSNLTDSAMELRDNTIAIIAEPEQMKRATEALIAIIKGAKHGAVYKELEHNFIKQEYDLGLRDAPVKTMEDYEAALSEDDAEDDE
jgi:ribosomal RNA assembly protein